MPDVAVGQQGGAPPALARERVEDAAQQRGHAAVAGLPDGLGHDVDAQHGVAGQGQRLASSGPGPQPMSRVGPWQWARHGPVDRVGVARARRSMGSGCGARSPSQTVQGWPWRAWV